MPAPRSAPARTTRSARGWYAAALLVSALILGAGFSFGVDLAATGYLNEPAASCGRFVAYSLCAGLALFAAGVCGVSGAVGAAVPGIPGAAGTPEAFTGSPAGGGTGAA